MKSLFSLLLLLLVSTGLFGQKTEKKTVKHENPKSKEVFYVLEGTDVRHGAYTKAQLDEPKWKEKGQYDNGRKTGVWEYYNMEGEVAQKFDYTNNTLVYSEPSQMIQKSFLLLADGTLIENTTGNAPQLLGGSSRFWHTLVHNVEYPREAQRTGVMGEVVVSATITKDGRIVDEKVDKGPGYGLNEEALRVVKLLPDEWLPLYVNGEAVATRIFIKIKFRLA